MSDARARAEDHYYAGLDLFAEGRYQDAVAEYRAAVAADPQFTDALHALSKVLQEMKDFDRAIEVAKQITALDPDDVLAHTSLSILYQNKGMIAEAEAESNKARILGWKQQLREQKTGIKPPESL
jgi:tetratricopeptide (TPR) repeat protein